LHSLQALYPSMSCFCVRYCEGAYGDGSMRRIAILGSSLSALEYAHTSLDNSPSTRVTVYTEDAEVGFPEELVSEELVMSEALNAIPRNWYSSIPEAIDWNTPSRSAGSWLSKSMAIRLASRGGRFLLHTIVLNIDEDRREISFRGGGMVRSGIEPYDELYDFR